MTKHQPQKRPNSSSGLRRMITAVGTSPVFWGIGFTYAFYAALPFLPLQRDLAIRYFCSHPLEYATAGLFFVGMAVLVLKLTRLPRERAVFTHPQVLACCWDSGGDDDVTVDQLSERLKSLPSNLQSTQLTHRLRDVESYLRGSHGTRGLEHHLKYLAELAQERLHDSYALVRTITWAVPILGFLGTVIGITMAIANITPEQLDSSLGDVTGGLAVAFDTTALALGLSLLLVFAAFVAERSEQKISSRVERFGIQQVLDWFPADDLAGQPLIQAEHEAAERLLGRTDALIEQQMELWSQSIELTRDRWQRTLDRQQQELTAALQQQVDASLAEQQRQINHGRDRFLAACENLAGSLSEIQQAWETGQRELHETSGRQLTTLWDQVHGDLKDLRRDQKQLVDESTASFREQTDAWLQEWTRVAQVIADQVAALQQQGELLQRLATDQTDLNQLQQRLSDNLEAVRAAETLEQTLHGLNAAVHLLTIKSGSKVA